MVHAHGEFANLQYCLTISRARLLCANTSWRNLHITTSAFPSLPSSLYRLRAYISIESLSYILYSTVSWKCLVASERSSISSLLYCQPLALPAKLLLVQRPREPLSSEIDVIIRYTFFVQQQYKVLPRLADLFLTVR